MMKHSTIVATATPPGRGGIGVIRVSGAQTPEVAAAILKQLPAPRQAYYTAFYDENDTILDQGLALYFPAPHSFTGEHVLELHAHGSPMVLDLILQRLLQLGATLARPGEFSERAFLNGKLDLVQAEAIADLIDASSQQAARSAIRSLQGEFSLRIHSLVDAVIQLRAYIEAMLDFPEEDIDLLDDPQIQTQLHDIQTQLANVQSAAKQGTLLRDGMRVVITGRPNVGKSSLLNQLSGQESAIVTDIPGTTRDVLREHVHIDGLPLHIIDTAGLRHSDDPVEQEGIRRAQKEIANADRILLMLDVNQNNEAALTEFLTASWPLDKLTILYNKIDLAQQNPRIEPHPEGYYGIYLSAKTGTGLELLRSHLKECLGFTATTESTFIARRRHLDALTRAETHFTRAKTCLEQKIGSELIAEELRLAQNALSEITGQFLPDDLLGEIFGKFCIGK